MSSSNNILSQLRDIREPPIPEATPLSFLTILALALLLVFLTLLVLFWLRNRRRSWLQHQITELRQFKLKLQSDNGNIRTDEELPNLAQILRHYVLHVQPPDQREKIAVMHGNPWLCFLDQTFATNYFTQSSGRVFGSSLYTGKTKNYLEDSNKRESEKRESEKCRNSIIGLCDQLELLFKEHTRRCTLKSRKRHNNEYFYK